MPPGQGAAAVAVQEIVPIASDEIICIRITDQQAV